MYKMNMGSKEKNDPNNFSQKDQNIINKAPQVFKSNKAPESAGPRPRGTNYDPAREGYYPSKKMEHSDNISGYSGYGKAYDEADGTFKNSRKQASKDLEKVTKAGKMIFKSI